MTDEPTHAESERLGAGKIILLLSGAVMAMVGVVAMIGGGVLVWAHATQRDAAGFYTTSAERFATSTYALTSNVDLGQAPGQRDWLIRHTIGTVQLRATIHDGEPLFIGIGPRADVDRWLADVAHEHVTGANFGSFHSQYVPAGSSAPAPPLAQDFWVASVSGPGSQMLRWTPTSGDWTFVVMRTDATPGLTADVDVGARTGILLPIGIGLGALGLLGVVAAAALIFLALRHQTMSVAPGEGPSVSVSVPGTYPARLNGHIDPGLSRWMWLVKWILVIPHVVALLFLWMAATVLTVVAGFSILFTGKYPRSIFDFNVGVMRWTWRVTFYGLSGLATDRYPPFKLQSDPDYPADFTVDYPEQLSRGLVLVKWWLLAIPHYLVVAVFVGGWGVGWNGAWRIAGGGGLITLLVVIAAVVLTITGRYPESIFDFVMGMNRWCYRVLTYVALMRDEYPPFRLDNGGTDPGSVTSPLPPAAPAPPGQLVDVGV